MRRGRLVFIKCLLCARLFRNITLYSPHNPKEVSLPPILKKRQLRFREITYSSEVIKLQSGQAKVWTQVCGHPSLCISSDDPRLWEFHRQPFSWLSCLKKLRTSHADNHLLLFTWTSCPFTRKGNDFQLHPINPLASCSAHGDSEAHPSLRLGLPAPILLR